MNRRDDEELIPNYTDLWLVTFEIDFGDELDDDAWCSNVLLIISS